MFAKCLHNGMFIVICAVCVKGRATKYLGPRASHFLTQPCKWRLQITRFTF